ncbi:MAG: conjugal transfer protein TraR [Bacteroidetes bacterium]|nr:conjugal transfer protein TraR [Bacteroidota bacterium]
MANKKTGKKTSAKDKKNKLKKTTIKSTSKKKNGKKISIMVKKKTTSKKKPLTKAKKTIRKPVTKKNSIKKTIIIKVKKTAVKKTRKAAIKKPEVYYEDVDVKAAARAVAIKKIKGYSKKDLAHFKKIIIDKRDEIITQLQNLKEQMMDTSTGEYINENSPYSLHMAEQGTDAMEREKTFLYAQRETKFLGYLEAALKRIDAGTYGICIECIEKPKHLCETCPLVPVKRLEAVPHSQVCVSIKQKQEKK